MQIIKQPTWEELKDKYSAKNPCCETGHYGKVYSLRQDEIYNLPCNNYSCKKCRKNLKWQLFTNVYQQVKINDLNYHMVITFPGKTIRSKTPYYKSFPIMNHDWNKLKMVIKYKYPDFKDIIFPRAQSQPTSGNPIGFCHFHVIHNTEISKSWLDEKTKKYTLGYTYLRFNEDVAEYLHNDYFYDDEWIIPKNIKHYRSTRSIVLNPGQGYLMDEDNILFTGSCTTEKMAEEIELIHGRYLPFRELIRQYEQIQTLQNI